MPKLNNPDISKPTDVLGVFIVPRTPSHHMLSRFLGERIIRAAVIILLELRESTINFRPPYAIIVPDFVRVTARWLSFPLSKRWTDAAIPPLGSESAPASSLPNKTRHRRQNKKHARATVSLSRCANLDRECPPTCRSTAWGFGGCLAPSCEAFSLSTGTESVWT